MIAKFHELRPRARTYIICVVLAGACVIGLSGYQLVTTPISNRWLILAALTLLTGSFNVKVSSINAYISVSEAFVFASILLFGTPAGTATVVLECLVILLWMKREGRLLHRVLFNMAAPSVAVWMAGTAFYLLSGIQPYSEAFTPLPTLFLPLLAFTALYFLLNSWLVAIAVGLESGRSSTRIWLNNFAWLSVNYFSGASLAALIVTYTKQLDLSSLAVIVPLLVVSYLTFRTAMGRAEDSYSHLSELNRLYLSTIETLAMAIDAKDQITHGHIRRVQAYAVGLAKAIGVSDETLLKAIEAAALLHDMGKLAVPEHILNKPGKLTAAEFEKMKLHASFGADMLSAINFPYPVVPIVRHHHENWNGTGYPIGLKGTDIPIGARILSVVDCFDALTSDRPYRPRLSDEAAISILMERRGAMYDPLVVDTFIRVHRDIAPTESITIDSHHPTTHNSPLIDGRWADVRSQGSHKHHATFSTSSINAITDLVDVKLRREVDYNIAIIFRYEPQNDELLIHHASGVSLPLSLTDLHINLGERLSGWVAANKKTILNSDPALDFGEYISAIHPRPGAALSVPLISNDSLIGVLSLYSVDSFTESDCQATEAIGRLLVQITSRADSIDRHDVSVGLPSVDTIPEMILRANEDSSQQMAFSLLFVEIEGLAGIISQHGTKIGNFTVHRVANTLRESLDNSDMLFKGVDGEFVALVARNDSNDVWQLAKYLREQVRRQTIHLENGRMLDIHISTHGAQAPADTAALRELLAAGHVAIATTTGTKDTRYH